MKKFFDDFYNDIDNEDDKKSSTPTDTNSVPNENDVPRPYISPRTQQYLDRNQIPSQPRENQQLSFEPFHSTPPHSQQKATATFSKTSVIVLMVVTIILSLAVSFVGSYLGMTYSTDKIITNESPNITINGSGGSVTASDIYSAVLYSTVSITSSGTSSIGAGSGVIVSSTSDSSYIITNEHVINNALTFGKLTGSISISYFTKEGKKGYVPVFKVVSISTSNDLALLRIEIGGLQSAILGDSLQLKYGQEVVVIGNALGLYPDTVGQGLISGLNRTATVEGTNFTGLIQTNTTINQGNSGGGMFDYTGQLIGIVNAKSGGDLIEGIGFAIPINQVKAFINTSGDIKVS